MALFFLHNQKNQVYDNLTISFQTFSKLGGITVSKNFSVSLKLVSQVAALAVFTMVGCTQEAGNASESGIQFVKKDGGAPGAVAKFMGKDISADELERSSPEIFDAKLGVFEAQKHAVEEFVRQQILTDLAKKANLGLDDYLQKETEKAKKDVSEKAVAEFLKQHGVAKPDEVPARIKDQVRGLIHMQSLISSQTKKNQVEFYLKRPMAPKLDFNMAGEASWGNADAPIQVVEFSDFQCPFCAKGKERLNQLKKEYGKKLHVVYKNFPLPMHPDAMPAANAALCVNEQGADKFWAFHDVLFENQQKLSADDLKAYAKKVGADTKKFEECFAASKYKGQIEASQKEGQKMGVNSTPTFYVNGQPVHGAKDISEFREIIDESLPAKN